MLATCVAAEHSKGYNGLVLVIIKDGTLETSSSKGHDSSPESQQVKSSENSLNNSQVRKQLSRAN